MDISRITGVQFRSTPPSQQTDALGSSGGTTPAGHVPPRRPKRWRKALIALLVIILVFSAATARLFVWPVQGGMPPQVNAIVMLDGPGDVLDVAVRLAAQHRAPYLVVSQGTVASHDPCPAPIREVKLICFNAVPANTQGEAEFIGLLAKDYHWTSIAVVTIRPQATRARLRVQRCFGGQVYLVTAPLTRSNWPYQIAYQWGALMKALVIERGC